MCVVCFVTTRCLLIHDPHPVAPEENEIRMAAAQEKEPIGKDQCLQETRKM